MEFICKGEYNNKTMAVMAKVLRKTVRKRRAAVPTYLDGELQLPDYCYAVIGFCRTEDLEFKLLLQEPPFL